MARAKYITMCLEEMRVPNLDHTWTFSVFLSHNRIYLICVFYDDCLWFKANILNKEGILDCCNLLVILKRISNFLEVGIKNQHEHKNSMG